MIEVLFFAKLREDLGVSRLSIEITPEITNVASLQNWLIDQSGESWAVILNNNIIRSVNQQVVESDHVISDGNEVAFFPPVTGG